MVRNDRQTDRTSYIDHGKKFFFSSTNYYIVARMYNAFYYKKYYISVRIYIYIYIMLFIIKKNTFLKNKFIICMYLPSNHIFKFQSHTYEIA